ncbi:hypothetical protein ACIBJE_21155 [Micromonospora sp. NPDC050187]
MTARRAGLAVIAIGTASTVPNDVPATTRLVATSGFSTDGR